MNSPSPDRSVDSVRRIVVRGVNWLGDAVMTTPALMRLRERFPGAHIAILTPAKLEELWFSHPAIDEAIPFTAGEGLFSVSQKLRQGRFDLALVLPNSPRSALEPWLAGIPRRVGYARSWRNHFLTNAVPSRTGAVKMRKRSEAEIQKLIQHPSASRSEVPTADAHQLTDYLHLVAAFGASAELCAPRLVVTDGEVASARKKFGLEENAKPIFGLNAGAEYGPAKRWPGERFIAAAREIQKQTGCVWLILGGPGDSALAGEIQSAFQNSPSSVRNLAGRTSLRELCAVLKLCRAVLTNDTGPMHVAAALGTPVVAPFGSTSPVLTGPGLPGDSKHVLLRSSAPCSPCFRRECPIDFRCMNEITVDRVVAAMINSI